MSQLGDSHRAELDALVPSIVRLDPPMLTAVQARDIADRMLDRHSWPIAPGVTMFEPVSYPEIKAGDTVLFSVGDEVIARGTVGEPIPNPLPEFGRFTVTVHPEE